MGACLAEGERLALRLPLVGGKRGSGRNGLPPRPGVTWFPACPQPATEAWEAEVMFYGG